MAHTSAFMKKLVACGIISVLVSCGGKAEDISDGGTTSDANVNPSPFDATFPPPNPSPGPNPGPGPGPGPNPPPPVFDAGVSTLYQRLGGHAGIQKLIAATLTRVLQDPQQASYFVHNVPTPAAGHPTAADIVECFTDLVGSATGGPESYPTTTPSGFKCRDMVAAHAGLHIPNGVFNDFASTAAATAIADGVTPADVARLGALMNTTRSQIVDPARGDGGFYDGG